MLLAAQHSLVHNFNAILIFPLNITVASDEKEKEQQQLPRRCCLLSKASLSSKSLVFFFFVFVFAHPSVPSLSLIIPQNISNLALFCLTLQSLWRSLYSLTQSVSRCCASTTIDYIYSRVTFAFLPYPASSYRDRAFSRRLHLLYLSTTKSAHRLFGTHKSTSNAVPLFSSFQLLCLISKHPRRKYVQREKETERERETCVQTEIRMEN